MDTRQVYNVLFRDASPPLFDVEAEWRAVILRFLWWGFRVEIFLSLSLKK